MWLDPAATIEYWPSVTLCALWDGSPARDAWLRASVNDTCARGSSSEGWTQMPPASRRAKCVHGHALQVKKAMRAHAFGVDLLFPPPPSSAAVIVAALHILEGGALHGCALQCSMWALWLHRSCQKWLRIISTYICGDSCAFAEGPC